MDREKAPGGHTVGVRREERLSVCLCVSLSVCVCVFVWARFTLCGFALSDQIGAPRIAGGQQLSLCILATQFTKVPAARKQSAQTVWITFL